MKDDDIDIIAVGSFSSIMMILFTFLLFNGENISKEINWNIYLHALSLTTISLIFSILYFSLKLNDRNKLSTEENLEDKKKSKSISYKYKNKLT